LKPTTHNALSQQATVAIGMPKTPSSTDRSSEKDKGISRFSAADLSQEDLSGHVFAQYELGKRIGQGGMGQVYLAKHRHLGKSVAIKFIRHDLLCREAQSRFLQEIQAVGTLNHSHLIHAIDAGELDGVLYCVTEYMDGHDLHEWVRLRGPLPMRAAAEVIRQAAIGLQYAHQQGFVHRDIKPSNLFLETHGNIRVLDFGLAFHAKQQPDLTSQGQLLGTVDYISPEQARNAHSATPQSDLYSLGASLIYLLSEKPPFPDELYPALTNKLVALTTSLPPFFSKSSNLPPAIREVLQRTLNIEPSLRYQSARELVLALDGFASANELANWMIHGSRVQKRALTKAESPQKANRFYWGAIAATAAVAMPLGGYFAVRSQLEVPSVSLPLQPVSHNEFATEEGPVSPDQEDTDKIAPRQPLREFDGRPAAATAARTMVHQSGSSRNARAIGSPSKKLSEAISNEKGTP
jgi:serine/threonine protein kinase